MEFFLIVTVLILLFGASAFRRGLGGYSAIGAIALLFFFIFRLAGIETTTGFLILAAALLVGGLVAVFKQPLLEELPSKPKKFVDASGRLVGLEAEIRCMDNRGEESTGSLVHARQTFLDVGLRPDDFHIALIDSELGKRAKQRC
ncbi:hypothetical protein ACFX5Q_15130 [Mesorhizobium sp. IMUNJ 23033]|uniref:hypothetical protein n=1 Tax=Mesorhizobium sp. IMUNJ 23033 TaxID=3378039 RepID=UPI00384B9999